ncbi:hypothetical protein GIB67_021550 [Kingdonia uniflora]|uniref:Uncharacterized protein n=1 Tax=Kingdonia uniflora TaxID=39325 RepID=A0A7J7L9X6_9MAGN|nr:hypothetical protein GIB67_021550 [Kingdonia uniflora]
MIIQMKPIHVCLILGLRVLSIANEFLFIDPEHMTNFRMRRFPKKKNTYGLKEIDDALKQAKLERHQDDVLRLNLLKIILSFLLPNKGKNVWVNLKFPRIEKSIYLFPKLQAWRMISFKRRQIVTFKKFFTNPNLLVIAMNPSETGMQQDLVQEAMRYQIEAPAIGTASVIGAPIVGAPAIMGDNTLPLRDTPLFGQYQFSIPEKTTKRKREGGNEKEDGKRKKAELRTKKGKGEWQKKAEEDDVPNKKKKVEGLKKEAFTDDKFDHVLLIQLKTLIPKILKKGLANRVSRKRRVKFPELENIQSTAKNLLQQVAPGKGLEVVNDLMVDDDVEVGREVNFKAISFEYGGDLLDVSFGDEKDNDEKKDIEEKVKYEEEQPQVAKEEDSEPPTVVVYYNEKKNETMVVARVAKTDIVFFNQEEVVGEAYQASADQTTAVSVEKQTLEVEKTEDEASQASADQTTAVFVEQ